MTFAFARDGGLPFSRWFARVHKRLGLPLNALCLTTVLVIIFGCIFLGSSSAFSAITSASVVALEVSYGIPVAVNCLQGRSKLPPRAFVLSPILGWTFNLIGLAFVILTSVLFLFPPELPVSGSNMNYCVAAFGIVLIISVVQWIVDGRKNYTGPRIKNTEEVLVAQSSHQDCLDGGETADGAMGGASKGVDGMEPKRK